MASAIELCCPRCSQVLGRSRRARIDVGRPFEECPRCRVFVERPRCTEWDLLGAGEKAAFLADRLAPFLVLGLVPALAGYALGLRSGAPDLRLVLGLFLGGLFVLGFFPVANVLHTVRRSRSRMSDPMYRARLVEYGRKASERTA